MCAMGIDLVSFYYWIMELFFDSMLFFALFCCFFVCFIVFLCVLFPLCKDLIKMETLHQAQVAYYFSAHVLLMHDRLFR